ncbi:MAG: hypothetical protein ABJ308_04535 [Halieaceae bacterium]
MKRSNKLLSVRRARGFALLALMTLLVLALSAALIARLSLNQRATDRIKDNADILGLAADSLLGYALQQIPPGTLPCPDTDGDGLEDATAGGCQSQRGLLPVRTLNTGSINDRSGAALWYAVELNLVSNAGGVRNPSRATTLLLDNVPVAAVLVAPGAPLAQQGRAPLLATDFLEGVNADATLNTYARPVDDTGNDQLLALGLGGFWTHMARRVLAVTGQLLVDYRAVCAEYPWAASFAGPFDSVPALQIGSLPLNSALPNDWGTVCATGTAPTPPAWLSFHWSDQIYYRMCTVAEGNCLSTVGNVNPAGSAVLLSPGVTLAAQLRPSGAPANYFELENIAAPNTQFRDLDLIDHTGAYNDVTAVLAP